MTKIKFAIIGTGYISHYHAHGIIEQPDAELVSICSRTLENAKEFAAKYGITQITNDFEEVCQNADVDAIVITTPNVLHKPFAIKALQAGKHVLIEKPLAMDASEAEEINAVAQETNLNVMVGHMWRFDKETQDLKTLVQSGQFGEIVKTKGYGVHVNWGPEGWFTKKCEAGGGALIDMGVHAIDTVRYLLGDPEPAQVFATIETRYGQYDVDDHGIIVIKWKNGTTSIIESGWWNTHADGPEASTQLFGTEGYAQLFPTGYKLKGQEQIQQMAVPAKTDHCDQGIYDEQINQFVLDLQLKRPSIPGILEGTWVMKIVDAAYASSESGKVINF